MKTPKKVGGWLQCSVNTVYENPWIKVTHEDVKTPANTDGIYGVVHFKSHAVGILPIDDQGNTWLVRQTRYPLNRYTWEIPEGGAVLPEPPLLAAQRELQEEVGLSAESWRLIANVHLSNSVTDEEASIYIATGLSEVGASLEETEDIEVKKLPLAEAAAMADNGAITDVMSVLALTKVRLLEDYQVFFKST